MGIIPASAYNVKLPKMYKAEQTFCGDRCVDIDERIRSELCKPEIRGMVRPGMRIALAVGSRGISNIAQIVKTVGSILIEWGAFPFIVPAMGSHGNGEAEGQRAVLAGYGITNQSMGFPVLSSMEVDDIGTTDDGLKVCIDRIAHTADLIVPIARIKPHTDFKGSIESGLCKMLTIGLGKHEGCSRLHQRGFGSFASLIPEAARVVIRNCKVGFGVAIIENGYDQTYLIEAVPGGSIFEREPELLKIAREMMPAILLKEIDILIVDQIGKDITGAGMDPNIVGRTTKGLIPGFSGPTIQRIIVQDLTEATHGNACGIGLADFVLEDCVRKIDLEATYTNCVGSGNPEAGRIPIRVSSLREGVLAALRTCVGIENRPPKIVRISNTLALGQIWISQSLTEEAEDNPRIRVTGETWSFA